MTEMGGDVSAGRLSMDAYVDTAGLTRGLQRRIDAEIRTIRANIKAQIDTSSLVGQAREAASQASRAAKVKFATDFDTRDVIAKAKAAAVEATKAAKVRFQTDFDTSAVATQAKAAAADASKTATVDLKAQVDQGSLDNAKREVASVGGDAKVDVAADTDPADRDIDALRARQKTNPINIPVVGDSSVFGNSLSAAGDALAKFSTLPAIIGGVYTLGAAVGQLAGGLVSMAAAASSAVSVLSVIPSLASAAVQGVGAVVVGFSGIGGAVSAMMKQQDTAATATKALAAKQVTATHQIADAQYALGQAEHKAAEDARASREAITQARQAVGQAIAQQAHDAQQSARQIADAERAVADAERNEQEAVKGLNEARQKAIEYIQDLRRELRASVTEELAATDKLQTAKEHLADVNFDKTSTAAERRDAILGVKQAQDALAKAKDHHEDLAKENAKATRTGVEGTDIMIAARKKVADAERAEQDAVRSLADARRNAAYQAKSDAAAVVAARQGVAKAEHAASEQAKADAHAVMIAHRNLRDAQAAGATAAAAQTAQQVALASALQHLSPAGKAFAQFIVGLLPRLYEFRNAVQAALLPPLQRGITAALPLLDTLQTGLVDTATVIGGLGLRLGRLFGRKTFNTDVAKIMRTNNIALRLFGDAAFSLLRILRDVAVVAGPTLLVPFARWVRVLTQGWAEAAHTARETGRMATFFERARAVAVLLYRIMANLAGAIFGVGKAAQGAGRGLLRGLADETERWSKAANSPGGQRNMRRFFNAVKPVTREIGQLATHLASIFVKLSASGASPIMAFVTTLNAVATALDKAASTPGLGKALGWIATLAGSAGALGFLAGYVLKFSGLLITLNRTLGLSRIAMFLWKLATDASERSLLLLRVQLILLTIQEKLSAVAAKAMAAGQWLLNAALEANPIGIIIGLLVAFGVALVVLYKKNATFRRIVQVAWAAIQLAVGAAWRNVIKPVFRLMVAGLQTLGKWGRWLWRNVIVPAWRGIQLALQTAWRIYYKPLLTLMWRGLQTLGKWFNWLWHNVVQPVWHGIQNLIQDAWRNVIKPVFTAIRKGIGNVADAFRTAANNIGKWWKKIQNAVKGPIKGTIQILNTWVIDKFNWLSGKLGGPKIPEISLKGFKGGGDIPGYSPTSVADNIPILATAKEFMIRRKSAERLRRKHPGALEYMNRFGRIPGNPGEAPMGGAAMFAAGGRIVSKAVTSGIQRLARGGSVWPTVGRAVSTYPGHDGADINQPPGPDFGAPIFAWRSGKITYAGWGHGYGHAIFEKAPGYPTVVYGHGSEVDVHSGQSVRAGQKIGNVGATGNASGPHLHFGVPGGTFAQAMALLKGAGSAPGGAGDPHGGVFHAVASFLSTLGGKVAGAVRHPAEWLLNAAKGKIANLVQANGGTPLVKMLAQIPKKLITSAGSKISGLFHTKEAAYNKSHLGDFLNNAVGNVISGAAAGPGDAHLVPAMVAARHYAINRWHDTVYGYANRNIAGTSTISDHALGKAIDIMNPLGRKATQIANYFATGPGHRRFNIENTIHDHMIHNDARGWHAYHGANPHTDHIHVDTYDRGGALYPGSTLSVNRTGKTETVFTNDNMVALTRDLKAAAASLRHTQDAATVKPGSGSLVENLSITGRPEDVPDMLRDATFQLKVIRQGGVHVRVPT